jgi:hypothetical protein
MSTIVKLLATTRAWLALGWGLLWRLVNQGGVVAALVCFWQALGEVQPHGFAVLAGRTLNLPPVSGFLAIVPVPNAAAWPLQAAWLVIKPAARLHSHQAEAIKYIIAGAGLLLVVNWLNWWHQTVRNETAKLAVMAWVAAVVLTAFDLVHVLVLPLAWDNLHVAEGVSAGEALRAAEIILSVYLWSCVFVLKFSRADAHVIRPWGQISGEVRRQLTIRAAFVVALWPYLSGLAHYFAHVFKTTSDMQTLINVGLIAAVIWLFVWAFIGQGIWLQLVALTKFAGQIMATRPLLAQTFTPPPSSRTTNRGSVPA